MSIELFPYDKLSFVVAWTALLHLYQIPVYHIPEVKHNNVRTSKS